jgi:hypothetical protein
VRNQRELHRAEQHQQHHRRHKGELNQALALLAGVRAP